MDSVATREVSAAVDSVATGEVSAAVDSVATREVSAAVDSAVDLEENTMVRRIFKTLSVILLVVYFMIENFDIWSVIIKNNFLQVMYVYFTELH